MLYIVAFLVLIGVLMIPHEWGHYIVARRAGMKVYEYSIGVGPEIFSRVRDGVKFSLRPIPIMAFVRIAGMEPDEADHPEGFGSKSIPWRFAVLVAGSGMNLLVALVVFIAAGMTFGKVVGTTSVVKHIDPQMPAYTAGFKVGDRIVEVNGQKIRDTDKFIETIASLPNKLVRVKVLREGSVIPLTVVPKGLVVKGKADKVGRSPEERTGRIGIEISSRPIFKRVGLVESIEGGIEATVGWTAQILQGMVYIFTHREGIKHVGGPIAIAKAAGDSAKHGLAEYTWFTGVLSINLAIFNLLPFLALDGGRMLFLLYELVRRKRIDPRKEFLANAIGMGFLLLLIVLITAKDLRDLIMK